jgi:hypothetical protein
MKADGYEGTYVLEDRWFKPVEIGHELTDKWGDTWRIDNAAPPMNSASSGRIYVTHVVEGYGRTFYPGVLDLNWHKL